MSFSMAYQGSYLCNTCSRKNIVKVCGSLSIVSHLSFLGKYFNISITGLILAILVENGLYSTMADASAELSSSYTILF